MSKQISRITDKHLADLWAVHQAAYTKGPLHAHGGYLSVRDDISRTVEHLDEMGQRRYGAPFQAIPIFSEADCAKLAAAWNALPALIAEIQRMRGASTE